MLKPAAMDFSTEENVKSLKHAKDLHLQVVEAGRKLAKKSPAVNRNRVQPEISDDVDDLWDNVPV